MRQVIVGGHSNDALNTAATEYNFLYGTESNTWFVTESARRSIIAGNGILHTLKVFLSAAPGSSGSYVFTVRKNAAATALAVTITDPATSAELTTSEVSYTAGDRWTFECAPSGGPSATPTAQWSLIGEDTDDVNQCWITGGHPNTMPTIFSERNSLAGGDVWSTPIIGDNAMNAPFPLSGTIKNFYVRLNTAPGAGTNYQISVNRGATALLSKTISGTNTNGSDLSSASISAGDNINMESNPGSIPTARSAMWGVCFVPDEPYHYPVLCQSMDFIGNNEYNSLFASGQLWTGTESTVRTRVKMGVIKRPYICAGTAPGTGTSVTLTLVLNGSDTGLTVTLSDTATTAGNTSHQGIEVQDGDEVSIKCTTSGAVATTNIGWSVAYFTYSPWMYSSREGNMGN